MMVTKGKKGKSKNKTSKGSSPSSSPSRSPVVECPEMSDEYITLARAVLRYVKNHDDLLVDTSGVCYMDDFTNDWVIMPPIERFPGCVRYFTPDTHPDVFLNDKKQHQRTGRIITLKPEANKITDLLKTFAQPSSNKFIPSAGITQTSSLLEKSLITLEHFYTASETPLGDKTPEDYFTETISLRDQFEKTLIATPSTPEEIKVIARERCKTRASLTGEFRMRHRLFNVGYSAMYELFEEFEQDIAANLIERGIDNNKIDQYYIGSIKL